MKNWFHIYIAIATLALVACEKVQTNAKDERNAPAPEAEVVLERIEPIEISEPEVQPEAAVTIPEPQPFVEPAAKLKAERVDYMVLAEPWKRYFRSDPKIMVIREPSQGILDLLEEQERIVKQVLDLQANPSESSQFAELEERLSELKTLIPDAETASGYVPGSSQSRTYTYISGGTVYTRSRRYYYDDYYYRVFRKRIKSSSPELVRSVHSVVHNTVLTKRDLDQRIEALQMLSTRWGRRTAEMNANGTSGIMRKANSAYLSELKRFMRQMIDLRSKVVEAEKVQAGILRDKEKILENWRVFETSRLPILDEYFKKNSSVKIAPDGESIYSVPETKRNEITVLMCDIGGRDLFFQTSTDRSPKHPFVMIDVNAQE